MSKFTAKESKLMTHDRWAPAGILRVPIRFGHGVRGNLYYKKGLAGPVPVVIWLTLNAWRYLKQRFTG